jgi:hypothetical protein
MSYNHVEEEGKEQQICIGGVGPNITLYKIDKEMKLTLLQTFPKEHKSYSIDSLLQLNKNTLISASSSYCFSGSDNIIVVWSKSKTSLYEPIQRITKKETEEGEGVSKLISINRNKDEEEFASSSPFNVSVTIWTRRRRRRCQEDEELFQIKQQIINENGSGWSLIYISSVKEIIFQNYTNFIQIFQSSLSLFEKRQDLQMSSTDVISLVGLVVDNKDSSSLNNVQNRIEFASGHSSGQIMIWFKQINNSDAYTNYSLLKILKPFDASSVDDLMFIQELNCLIACSKHKDKIVIYKNKKEEEEKEELEHKKVTSLVQLRNGVFASGGEDQLLQLWTPEFT